MVDYSIHCNSTEIVGVHLRISLRKYRAVADAEEVEWTIIEGDSQSFEIAGLGARVHIKKQWTCQVGAIGPSGFVGGHDVIVLIFAGRIVRKALIEYFWIAGDWCADGSYASRIQSNDVEHGCDILREERNSQSLVSEQWRCWQGRATGIEDQAADTVGSVACL